MKVLEIKNNLVKIAYEAQDNLALSGFVIIEDNNNPYVAQVVNIKGDLNSNFAIVKLLFTFDEDGILKNYNGTIPSANAKVSSLPSSELLDIIPVETPIFMGNIAQQNAALRVDKSIFENNLLICSDNLYNTTSLLDNLLVQIDEKTVIIDTEGQISSGNKIKLGVDFKLPLNYEAIDFIYENDLEDVDAINKAIIQDVFIEVQNYVKTLPEKYLPFDTFVNVIDSQYRETQIPELILLKNKLLKYKEMNIFAQNLKDIVSLEIAIEKNQSIIVDISDIPDSVKKEVLRYLYEVLNNINSKIYSFVKVNNSNVTKRLLKKFIERNNVFTTIICPHEFKYIEDVKEVSQNIIFFAPLTLTHDFASYNTYLSKLNNEEFVIYGAHTQNIPFITEVTDIEDMVQPSVETQSELLSQSEPDSNSLQEDEFISVDNLVIDDSEESTETNEEESLEQGYNDDFVYEYENPEEDNIEIVEDNPVENNLEEDNIQDDTTDEIIDVEEEPITDDESYSNIVEDEADVIEESEESDSEYSDDSAFDNIGTYNNYTEEYDEDPVVEPLVTEGDHEQMVEQAAKDVDRMFYEKIEDNEPDDFADTSEDLTEDDLNMIEDMAEDDIPLAGELDDTLPVEDEELPPVVPIYPADDIEEADSPEFQPGERVSTAKYGEGVVEKMIKYGNKMLCSIDFPSIGRRLLDPAMTEITRIS